MIHVDIRETDLQFVIEVSTDGGGWSTIASVDKDGCRDDITALYEAERYARVFAHGCRYSGRDVRATALGSERSL